MAESPDGVLNQLSEGLVDQLSDTLADQLSDAVADQQAVADQLSEGLVDQLSDTLADLQARVDGDRDAVADPAERLRAENAVAAGIALLGTGNCVDVRHEHNSASARPILARDLLVTVDLVLRAVRHQRLKNAKFGPH